MSAVWAALVERAQCLGRPLDETVRRHVLEGVLRRLARMPTAAELVLRGSMRTRVLVAPRVRIADDLDFVGTSVQDAAEMAKKFARTLDSSEIDDEVSIAVDSLRAWGIWQDTAFPGVRLSLRAGFGTADQSLQIDVGFNDPLVPPPQRIGYPMLLGDAEPVWAVRPETAVAWKLHGLAEMGPLAWRPKDLHDLYLLLESVPLDDEWLPAAIEAAFVSRGYAVTDAAAVFTTPGWWELKSARVKWREHRRNGSAADEVEELQGVVGRVQERLRPALQQLQRNTSREETR
jgi:hypothetical protein